MKRILIPTAIVFAALFVWHLHLATSLQRRWRVVAEFSEARDMFDVRLNPFNNVVNVYVGAGSGPHDALESLGGALAQTVLQTVGPAVLERELATRVREEFDVYAMILPYRVRVSSLTTAIRNDVIQARRAHEGTTAKITFDASLWARSGGTWTNRGGPLATLVVGAHVEVLEFTSDDYGDWVRVKTSDGSTGWVHQDYVE